MKAVFLCNFVDKFPKVYNDRTIAAISDKAEAMQGLFTEKDLIKNETLFAARRIAGCADRRISLFTGVYVQTVEQDSGSDAGRSVELYIGHRAGQQIYLEQ